MNEIVISDPSTQLAVAQTFLVKLRRYEPVCREATPDKLAISEKRVAKANSRFKYIFFVRQNVK